MTDLSSNADTSPGADTDVSDREPLSSGERAMLVLLAVGAPIYLVLGLQFAAAHSSDRAGLTGLSSVMGLLSQVLGWPLFLLLQ